MITLLFLIFGLLTPLALIQGSASAAHVVPPGSGSKTNNTTNNTTNTATPPATDPAANSTRCATAQHCELVTQFIQPFVDFLAALVGVAVVISIIIGGIQYSSSAGDPQKASAAKNRIRNAIIALIVFFLLFGMLNFLIPGGL